MAYEIGTASGYLDVLERLKEFASDPDRAILSAGMDIDELDPIQEEEVWEVKRWNTDWDGDGGYELILAGPGVTGLDDILIGAQSWKYEVGGGYNWAVAGFTGFDEAFDFVNQPGFHGTNTNTVPHVLLNNSTIKYWFFANGRRICGVCKVGGTYYSHFYLGYILPYGLPSQYPYPMLIGGQAHRAYATSSMVYSIQGIHNSAWFYSLSDGTYWQKKSAIFWNGTWTQLAFNSSSYLHFWPWYASDTGGSWGLYGIDNVSLSHRLDMNDEGEPAIFPMVLTTQNPDVEIYGEAHDVYYSFSDNVVSEDEILIDGETYIAFQNGYRNDSYDFIAIKKE